MTARTALEVFVPGVLKNPNNGAHGHWSVQAKYRQRWRAHTFLAFKAAGHSEFLGRSATPKALTLRAHVWNLYDEDGLAAALKPCLDGCRDAGLIHDDSPRGGHVITREQVIDRQHRGVTILARSLDDVRAVVK